MAYLELKKIKKSYTLNKTEKFPVLKGISLKFDKGEFVSILGESGGGKSTLMNIIGGLDHNYEGDVVLDKKSTKDFNEQQMDEYRRQTLGFIFQSFNLINYETNLGNVMTSLNMTTLSGAQRKERAIELLKQVGLGDHINKYPSQLSGGQRQRVAIARALASDPDMIIADEPTGALDSKNTKDVLEILENIAKSGKLVLVVTHSQEVADYGTRIVHMADGKIDADEPTGKKYKEVAEEQEANITSKALSSSTIWGMAFNHLKYGKLKNFLITLGSAIGIFSVMLFLGLGNGIQGYINKQVTELANPTALYVLKNQDTDSSTPDLQRVRDAQQKLVTDYNVTTMNSDMQNKIAGVTHVTSVEPAYQFANVQLSSGSKNAVASQFVSWSSYETDNNIVTGGKPGAGEVVIDKGFADQIDSNNANVIGKTVTIKMQAVNAQGMPVLISFDAKVSGITNSTTNPVYGIDYQTMHDQLSKAGAASEPTAFVANVDKAKNVKKVATAVNALKDGDNRLFAAVDLGSILDTINTITSLASTLLASIAGISLVVSAIMIIVTTYMSVAERTKEIGVLRALGGRAKDVRRLFTNESLMLGLLSAVLGLIAAFVVSWALNSALYSSIQYSIVQINIGNIIFAIVISLVIALLSAIVPSRKAAKLDPIESLAAD